jgi:two-component system alkaline phosphatase synthesis response regulator PhoP
VEPHHSQPQPAKPEPESSTSSERRVDPRARVLVVEDEHDLRALIAEWLESRGYQVVEAADGADAAELLGAGLEPDVILLDLGLPRMSGRQFLDWIREQPRHAHRPVIVASAYLDGGPKLDAEQVFAKPFRPDQLARELERILGD